MGVYTWNSTDVEFAEDSIGETRAVDAGDMTVSFERLKAGFSTAPLAKGLPDDACQCPHWGVVVKGRMRITTASGEEIAEAGSAYYLAPGHNVTMEEDCDVVEFSPAAARRVTAEHFEKTAAALMGA
jgi:hypothetical protein